MEDAGVIPPCPADKGGAAPIYFCAEILFEDAGYPTLSCGQGWGSPNLFLRGNSFRRCSVVSHPVLRTRVGQPQLFLRAILIEGAGIFHSDWPAQNPEAQAHWKLNPPSCPVTSTTSPMK